MTARQFYERVGIPAAVVLAIAAAAGFFLLAKTEWAGYSGIVVNRYQRAQTAGAIEIATVWRRGDPSLTIGAGIAAKELGEVRVGPQDKPRKLKIHLTSFDVAAGKETTTARAIARDTRFVAVIGHTTSDIANIASISYQQTNLLFLAVNATDPTLTIHDGFDFIFRTSPTDDEINDLFATTLATPEGAPPPNGRIAVLYTRSAHYVMTPYLDTLHASLGQKALSSSAEKAYGMNLGPPQKELLARWSGGRFGFGPAWLTYLRVSDELRNAVFRISEPDPKDLRAVIVLDDNPNNAAMAIARIRKTIPDVTVLGGLGVDDGSPPAQCLAPGTALPAKSLLVATTLCDDSSPARARFDAELPKPRPKPPFNYNIAWQGYRAVMILAQAMAKADSIAPPDVAAQLRGGMTFPSLGNVSFKPGGDLEGQKLSMKVR